MISVLADYDGFRHDSVSKYPSTRHVTSVDGGNPVGSTRGLAFAPKSGKLVKVSDARTYKAKYNDIPIAPLQYSSDSGTTWSVETYTGPDSSCKKGSAAISADGAVAVWVPGEGTTDVYRNYNSTTWEKVSGITNSAYVVGDPENANVFYAYDRTSGNFYRSSDQGASFSKASAPGKSDFKKFRAILGREGDLWLPIGVTADGASSGKLLHSTDGGSSWTEIDGVGYTEAVGFGISKTGTGYPALYVYAQIGDEKGVFGSDDEGATWTRLNDDGHEYGGLANGEFVMGDMNTYGVVYMSTAGRGIAARVPSSWNMGTSSSTSAISKPVSPLLLGRFANLEGNVLNLTLHGSRASVSLFDLNGNRVFRKSYSSSASLDLGEVVQARGTYIVRVTSGNALLLSGKVGIFR